MGVPIIGIIVITTPVGLLFALSHAHRGFGHCSYFLAAETLLRIVLTLAQKAIYCHLDRSKFSPDLTSSIIPGLRGGDQ